MRGRGSGAGDCEFDVLADLGHQGYFPHLACAGGFEAECVGRNWICSLRVVVEQLGTGGCATAPRAADVSNAHMGSRAV